MRKRTALARTLGVATVIAASISLTACGTSSNTAATAPATPKTPQTITYAIWGQPQLALMQSLAKAFEKKNPNITVNIDLTPYGQYPTKLETEASSGTLPDIFWMNSDTFPLYAANNQLAPITNLVDSKEINLSNYPSELVKTYDWNGKQYGVPKDYDTIALWYNKKLFDAAHQPYPTGNWTWGDYISASNAISKALGSQGIYGTAAPIDDDQASYYDSIPQAGGTVISKDGKKSGYDTPASIKGLNLWTDLIASGASPNVQQLNENAPVNWFTSGKAAMIWSGSYNISSMEGSQFAKDFGIVALPHDKVHATVLNGATNVVAATSKHKAAAQEFQAFLAGKQAAEMVARSGVVIPAYAGTQQAWIAKYPQWNTKVFIQSVSDGVPFPRSLNSATWEQYSANMLPAGWSGQQPMSEVAKNLATKMNAALQAEAK